MDGFTFLRLLMAQAPTPVIVISGVRAQGGRLQGAGAGRLRLHRQARRASSPDAAQGDPRRAAGEGARGAARRSRRGASAPPGRARGHATAAAGGGGGRLHRRAARGAAAARVAARASPPLCLLVAQHMPRALHPGLRRAAGPAAGPSRSPRPRTGDRRCAGHAFIAPGGHHLRARAHGRGGLRCARADGGRDGQARALGRPALRERGRQRWAAQALGVVLTGMGADGAQGARADEGRAARCCAESEETAVIFGMPKEAIATGGGARACCRCWTSGPAPGRLSLRRGC